MLDSAIARKETSRHHGPCFSGWTKWTLAKKTTRSYVWWDFEWKIHHLCWSIVRTIPKTAMGICDLTSNLICWRVFELLCVHKNAMFSISNLNFQPHLRPNKKPGRHIKAGSRCFLCPILSLLLLAARLWSHDGDITTNQLLAYHPEN